MPTNDSERGVGGWVRRWWRALLAELVSTLLLVMLGVAALLPADGEGRPLTHPALAFGFIVMANVEIFGPASGAHMNPAVTLAALVAGQLPGAAAAAYVLAQLFGALIGFGALVALAPSAWSNGATHPAPAVGLAAAVAIEAALTGLLALLACAVWAAHDQQRPDRAVSIKFGLAVAGLIYSGVYWVGPLGGALVGALLHRALLLTPQQPKRSSREDLPLNDKQEP